MLIVKLESRFKALGKIYQILAQENYYYIGCIHSQKRETDYLHRVKRIKKSINNIEASLYNY